MSLDPRLQRFLDLLALAHSPPAFDQTVAQRRQGLADLLQFGGPLEALATEEHALPGPAGPLPARLYIPREAPERDGAGIVYFHGGGLIAGSIETHDGIARSLAQASGCRLLSVGYRLGPEHRFPAGLDDALAAVRHVAARAADYGMDAARLIVCGDSAGATLSAAVCETLARSGDVRPILQLLLCPILDHSRTTESRRLYCAGFLVDQATLDHDMLHYLPDGADPNDPRISPLLATDLSGVPPTLVHTAEYDPLRDEGRAYFERLQSLGSARAYTCHAGMIHLFYGLGRITPAAAAAFQMIGAEVRLALGARNSAAY
jgi:acetyl esterase/lipase